MINISKRHFGPDYLNGTDIEGHEEEESGVVHGLTVAQ